MADLFPTSQNPRRSMSPLRFAQQLTPSLNPQADLVPTLQAPQPFVPLRSSSPMRQSAVLGVDGIGSSSPMGGLRGGPQTPAQVLPMHPSSPTPAADPDYASPTAAGVMKHQVGDPGLQPGSVTPPGGDIQYDKATNTFSNAAGRAMPLFSSPGAGGAGGTPGHPSASTVATMDSLQARDPMYQATQLRSANIATGMGPSGGGFNLNPNDPTLRMHVGGDVPGQGSGDKVPALLEPEEFVVSKAMLDEQPSLRGEVRGKDTVGSRSATRTKVEEQLQGIETHELHGMARRNHNATKDAEAELRTHIKELVEQHEADYGPMSPKEKREEAYSLSKNPNLRAKFGLDKLDEQGRTLNSELYKRERSEAAQDHLAKNGHLHARGRYRGSTAVHRKALRR